MPFSSVQGGGKSVQQKVHGILETVSRAFMRQPPNGFGTATWP